MKIKNPMLVVTDIDKSVEFYKKVFGFHVIMDFGANRTLTGGLALQTLDTCKNLSVLTMFLSAAIVPKFILKRITLINLLTTLKSVKSNMFIQSRNIRGVSVWSEFMTPTGILSRSAKI